MIIERVGAAGLHEVIGEGHQRRQVLVLDEIHKMRDWKSWLKGVYDGRAPGQAILVTGSARMLKADMAMPSRSSTEGSMRWTLGR